MDKNYLESIGITVNETDYPFAVLDVQNKAGSARISLLGGNVLSYAPAGERQVLWVSAKSNFAYGKAIRGGIPVCWPWFGPSPVEGRPAHGAVRTAPWELLSAEKLASDAVKITLVVSDKNCSPCQIDFPFYLELGITVGSALEVELRAFNTGDKPQVFQAALHTYFAVNEAEKITIGGLDKHQYTDKAPGHAGECNIQSGDLEIDREIDRVFCPASGTVKISDPDWRRTICVEKFGSLSTVVWNPWIAKSQAMADFGDNEYHKMVCVECANVLDDARTVPPGGMSSMIQKISVEKWD